jgi:hypothetical protein
MRLTLHHVPARQGLRWLSQGWAVFRRAPLAFSALLALYLTGMLVASLIPVVGPMLALGGLPLLSLVYMLHSHQALQARPMGFGLWAQPFKLSAARSRAQITLGALYVVGTVGLMLLGQWVDGGAMARLEDALAAIPADATDAGDQAQALMVAALGDGALLRGIVFRLGGAVLLSVPFWHAPALVHWGGQGALQALFSSTLGLWRNRSAFLLNGLAWLGLLLGASLVLGVVSALLGTPALLQLLVMPATLFMGSVFYAGLYFMFVDSFRFVADPPAADQS